MEQFLSENVFEDGTPYGRCSTASPPAAALVPPGTVSTPATTTPPTPRAPIYRARATEAVQAFDAAFGDGNNH